MKTTLAKSDWLTAQSCKKMAWLNLRTDSALSEAERFRMEQGQEVGSLARQVYPEGILVAEANGASAVSITAELLQAPESRVLFEATFESGNLRAKADILRREGDNWHLIEVKSSFADSSSLTDYLDDAAYTAMVLRMAGLPISTVSLILLSREYRFGQPPLSLFEYLDKTAEVFTRVESWLPGAESFAKEILSENSPPAKLSSSCRSCNFFDDTCLGSGLAHSVFELPALHHTKLKQLADAGIVDLDRIPPSLQLNQRQERAKYSAQSGNIVFEPGLAKALKAIAWPCHYLDFETVATVLPLYEGQKCHQQLLTQFSIHHWDALDIEPRHGEFLADASRDCERELAESLITHLSEPGSIIVYSGFEKTRINALIKQFEDLAKPLQSILDRLVDLLPIIQDFVYHPDFRGSFSIKKVLPALVPELSYSGLAVADGDTAIMKFAKMARGEIKGEEIAATRANLLAYCKLDTMAMLRLHEVLVRRASATFVGNARNPAL